MKKSQTKNKNRKKYILRFGLPAIAIVGVVALFSGSKNEKHDYVTINITRGNLSYTVSATGEIQPVNTVNVGSQVSGTIDNLYVDFNSNVKKGDILLTIEPSVLQASVDEAMASLTSAKSQRDFAFSEYKRNKSLYNDGFISRAEMEQSETTYNQAEQSVKKAQSTYDRAVTNLGYATITSPVDGTVISRKVDVGQTVAASFSTPDLFEIAEDLTKMQIETSVSEADIGVIREGQPVTFTVDAYPTDIFNGTVRQVRLSPTTTSNVVVYTVVIDVDNSDMRLMPGMTAFVTVIINSAENVYKAQNAAFLIRNFKTIDPTLDETITPDTHLAIMRNGQIQFIEYKKGLESATETQIISDQIMDGDRIVVGVQGQTGTTTKKNNNRGGIGGMGGAPMGGGGRR
ncbi:MAG: efflux RND transporter periplasmic adaptor subunit [Alphaproteobacteria bacterium]|nr:efflux RND transporter periplasmic adaptor subunit [Alphaproteobacteria bacterium]